MSDVSGRAFGPGDAPGRWFWRGLVVIGVVAFALRLAWVLAVAGHYKVGNDASFYLAGARQLADGGGYVNGLVFINPKPASAQFPPAFSTYLGIAAWIFGRSRLVAHLAVCLAGTGTVVLTGLVGRRVAGARLGLAAAAVAAVYPMLVVADGTLMSETLFTCLVMFSLVAAYRVLDRPTFARWGVLGATVGLAALTRGEGVLLVPLLVVPIAVSTRAGGAWHSVLGALAAVLALFAVMVPWTVRNLTTFHHPVLIANDTGTLLRGANCDATYHGTLLGSWSIFCDDAPGVAWSDNEAIHNARLERSGLSYVRHHKKRVLVVAAARLGRTFGVFRPVQQVDLGRDEGRPYGLALAGWLVYLGLVPFALIGAVHLLRRRAAVLPLVAVVAMVVITSIVTYGNTRFRTAMEPVVVILAVVGAATVVATLRERARHPDARAASPAPNPSAAQSTDLSARTS